MEDFKKHGDIEQNNIGKNIAYCRKYKGMLQRELADKLYVTQRAVSKWECGRSLPDISLLPRIAEIFGITLDELASENFSYENRRVENAASDLIQNSPRNDKTDVAVKLSSVAVRRTLLFLICGFFVFVVTALSIFIVSRYYGDSYRFEAEWGNPLENSVTAKFSKSINQCSGKGFVDFVAGGNALSYKIKSTKNTKAKMSICVGLRTDMNYKRLSDVFSIEVNDVVLSLDETVPFAQSNNWYDWYEIECGKIKLVEGENSIEITGINPLCLDYIQILPKSSAAILTIGDCTDVFCGETVDVTTTDISPLQNIFGQEYTICSVYDMDEYIGYSFGNVGELTNILQDGWISQNYSDTRVWKVSAVSRNAKRTMLIPVDVRLISYSYEAEWAENGIGTTAYFNENINNSSGKGFVDFNMGDGTTRNSIVITINASVAGQTRLDICVGMIREEYKLDAVYDILLNDKLIKADATVPRTNKNIWYDWIVLEAGDLDLQQGENRLEFVGKNPALCLDYIRIRPKKIMEITFGDCTTYYSGGIIETEHFDVSSVFGALELCADEGKIVSIYDMDEFCCKFLSDKTEPCNIYNGRSVDMLTSGTKYWKITAIENEKTIRTIVPVSVKFSCKYIFEAENAETSGNAVVLSGYGAGNNKFVDFFDMGMVSFTLEMAENSRMNMVVCLGLVSGGSFDFNQIYSLKVNGVEYEFNSFIPRGSLTGQNDWHDWTEVMLGEVPLRKGTNTIEFEGCYNESGCKPLCLDYIKLF